MAGQPEIGKRQSIATALEQIRKCGFECEAGPLTNNTAWQWIEGPDGSVRKF